MTPAFTIFGCHIENMSYVCALTRFYNWPLSLATNGAIFQKLYDIFQDYFRINAGCREWVLWIFGLIFIPCRAANDLQKVAAWLLFEWPQKSRGPVSEKKVVSIWNYKYAFVENFKRKIFFFVIVLFYTPFLYFNIKHAIDSDFR